VISRIRLLFRRESLARDGVAGLVLGVESVPDGLAGGILAGVNPIFGLHGYMFGTFTGAFFTSSSFMAVQATGAMAIIVADVGAIHGADNPDRALFTLSILTGLVMLGAGLLRLGSILRFVSNAVMVGFISAVGVNIVLGQLDNLTGYEGQGANRVLRALDHLVNFTENDLRTLAIGLIAIGLIVVLERTRLGPLGMVVALVIASVLVPVLGWDVAQLADIADIPASLPLPVLPELKLVPALLIPAASLAFVGLVQGAGISAGFPNPDGTYSDASEDFTGQGAANIVSGLFQGMPVGGSMSASSLVRSAGAKTRRALIIAAVVMAVSVLLLGPAIEYIAMPALAGLLIVVGVKTVKPGDIRAIWKTGAVKATVMTVTFVLTMLIALQYAVLVGVGISMILHVIGRSSTVEIKEWEIADDGRMRESEPPDQVPAHDVLILQPYGSLFFASAAVFEQQLPEIGDDSEGSVVVIRLRGVDDLGSTFTDVLDHYASALREADCKLVLISSSERLVDQLAATGVTDTIGLDNIYSSDEWLGATVRQAHQDAIRWVADRGSSSGPTPTD
jgi:SulP family sulfate permease